MPMSEEKKFCSAEVDLQAALYQWFQSESGKLLMEAEWLCVQELLSPLFGYYLLQVGHIGLQQEPLLVSHIQSRIVVTSGSLTGQHLPGLRADLHHLPIATDSVDVVILPHTLDFSSDPHQVLREVERVLIPEGRVIIIGFNPWSLWGVWHLIHRRRGKAPWCGQFISSRRLQDWFSLLGFDLEQERSLFYRPPLNKAAPLNRLKWMEGLGQRFWPNAGAVYLLQGVKRVSALTPLAPKWKIRPGTWGGRVAEPTTRTSRG